VVRIYAGTAAHLIGVDFFISRIDRTLFMVELDEDQHKKYQVKAEAKRPIHIREALKRAGNISPILFIRINPDGYKFGTAQGNVVLENRYEMLLDVINGK
jgi:hypothetical protein